MLTTIDIVTDCHSWRTKDSMYLDPDDGKRVTVFQPTDGMFRRILVFGFWFSSIQGELKIDWVRCLSFVTYNTKHEKLYVLSAQHQRDEHQGKHYYQMAYLVSSLYHI